MNTRLTFIHFRDIISKQGHTAFYKLSEEDRQAAVEIFKEENKNNLSADMLRIRFINKSLPVTQAVQDVFIDAVMYIGSGYTQKEMKKY